MSRLVAPLISVFSVALIFAILLSLSSTILASLTTGLGLTTVFFLPGLIWTYIFWPVDFGRPQSSQPPLPFITRLVLSLLLSIIIVPLGVLLANKIHIPLATSTTYFVALVIASGGTLILLWQNR